MHQRAYVKILSMRQVWRARKGRKRLAPGAAECNSSLLSALQTSQVLNISTYAQLMHKLIADVISVLNKNMKHARTIECDYVKILALL